MFYDLESFYKHVASLIQNKANNARFIDVMSGKKQFVLSSLNELVTTAAKFVWPPIAEDKEVQVPITWRYRFRDDAFSIHEFSFRQLFAAKSGIYPWIFQYMGPRIIELCNRTPSSYEFILNERLIEIPRPIILLDGNRIHCKNGPAIKFSGGSDYYFWRGLQVPRPIIMEPVSINTIKNEKNAEIRRILIERLGFDRFLELGDFKKLQQDDFGTLWVEREGFPPVTFVEVKNSTPEEDGTYKRYVIPVRSTVKSAHEAVASSFGMRTEQYNPEFES